MDKRQRCFGEVNPPDSWGPIRVKMQGENRVEQKNGFGVWRHKMDVWRDRYVKNVCVKLKLRTCQHNISLSRCNTGDTVPPAGLKYFWNQNTKTYTVVQLTLFCLNEYLEVVGLKWLCSSSSGSMVLLMLLMTWGGCKPSAELQWRIYSEELRRPITLTQWISVSRAF